MFRDFAEVVVASFTLDNRKAEINCLKSIGSPDIQFKFCRATKQHNRSTLANASAYAKYLFMDDLT